MRSSARMGRGFGRNNSSCRFKMNFDGKISKFINFVQNHAKYVNNFLEQNQKYATSTTQTTNSIRDIPIFRRTRHAGNLHAGLPADSHPTFSKGQNRKRRGILELRSGPRSQELELETLAASRAAVPRKGSG